MFDRLSIEQLHRNVPSIFTESPALHTSDKYKLISTLQVIQALETEGFVPVKAIQTQSHN
jgi:hypothetical protein